jgi:hypothetical protein
MSDLFEVSGDRGLEFYRNCRAFAVARFGRRSFVSDEFPAWAVLKWTPTRSRVDLLLVDFLRQEFGKKGSARSEAKKASLDESCSIEGFGSASEPGFEGRAEVADLLSRLPPRLAEAFSLVALDGLSLSEAALRLSVSKTRAAQLYDSSKVAIEALLCDAVA